MDEPEQLKILFQKFATRVAKEMRAPINNIVGLLDFTISESENSDIRTCLEGARASADTLQLLINELLEFSEISIEADAINQYPEDVPVWLTHTTRLHKSHARQRSQMITTTVEDSVPSPIIIDWKKLAQIVSQLLQNCIEYSPQHETISLSVSASKHSDENTTHLLHFSFLDQGKTFTPDERKALLKVAALDASLPAEPKGRRKSGTFGLGMTIATNLISKMGGTFESRTPSDGGNEFFVSIPARQAKL